MNDYEWRREYRGVSNRELFFERLKLKKKYNLNTFIKKCEKIKRKRYFDFNVDDFCQLIAVICAFICSLAAIASSLTLIALVIRCYIVV